MVSDAFSKLLQNNKYNQTALQELQKLALPTPESSIPVKQNPDAQNINLQNPHHSYARFFADMAAACIATKYNEVVACINAARDQLSSFKLDTLVAAQFLLSAIVKDFPSLKLESSVMNEVKGKLENVTQEALVRPQVAKAEEEKRLADEKAQKAAQEAAEKAEKTAKEAAEKAAKEAEAKKALEANKPGEEQQTAGNSSSMQYKPTTNK